MQFLAVRKLPETTSTTTKAEKGWEEHLGVNGTFTFLGDDMIQAPMVSLFRKTLDVEHKIHNTLSWFLVSRGMVD